MQKAKRKGRWLRRSLRILATLIVLFIVACFIYDHYVQFRRSDKEIREALAHSGVRATIAYFKAGNRSIRYMIAGSPDKPTLLFLHGSPGSMSYYTRRFADDAIRSKFRTVALDRPGYGYSDLGNPEASIQKQAALIHQLLDSIVRPHQPLIVVGSSYGAPIACRLAMDYPHMVNGLVLTGPAIGPGRETYFWFTNLIEFPAIRWFIPRGYRSANTEKVNHRAELEAMLPLWKNLKIPVAYLQGVDDDIVDTSNASFARAEMINVPYLNIQFIKGREHLLAQYEWPQFRSSILDIYERTKILPAK